MIVTDRVFVAAWLLFMALHYIGAVLWAIRWIRWSMGLPIIEF
jgi:hypothetical protein